MLRRPTAILLVLALFVDPIVASAYGTLAIPSGPDKISQTFSRQALSAPAAFSWRDVIGSFHARVIQMAKDFRVDRETKRQMAAAHEQSILALIQLQKLQQAGLPTGLGPVRLFPGIRAFDSIAEAREFVRGHADAVVSFRYPLLDLDELKVILIKSTKDQFLLRFLEEQNAMRTVYVERLDAQTWNDPENTPRREVLAEVNRFVRAYELLMDQGFTLEEVRTTDPFPETFYSPGLAKAVDQGIGDFELQEMGRQETFLFPENILAGLRNLVDDSPTFEVRSGQVLRRSTPYFSLNVGAYVTKTAPWKYRLVISLHDESRRFVFIPGMKLTFVNRTRKEAPRTFELPPFDQRHGIRFSVNDVVAGDQYEVQIDRVASVERDESGPPHASVAGPRMAHLAPLYEWIYAIPILNVLFHASYKYSRDQSEKIRLPYYAYPVLVASGLLPVWFVTGWWGHLFIVYAWSFVSGFFFAENHDRMDEPREEEATRMIGQNKESWLIRAGTIFHFTLFVPFLWPDVNILPGDGALSLLGTGILFYIPVHYAHYFLKRFGVFAEWVPHASTMDGSTGPNIHRVKAFRKAFSEIHSHGVFKSDSDLPSRVGLYPLAEFKTLRIPRPSVSHAYHGMRVTLSTLQAILAHGLVVASNENPALLFTDDPNYAAVLSFTPLTMRQDYPKSDFASIIIQVRTPVNLSSGMMSWSEIENIYLYDREDDTFISLQAFGVPVESDSSAAEDDEIFMEMGGLAQLFNARAMRNGWRKIHGLIAWIYSRDAELQDSPWPTFVAMSVVVGFALIPSLASYIGVMAGFSAMAGVAIYQIARNLWRKHFPAFAFFDLVPYATSIILTATAFLGTRILGLSVASTLVITLGPAVFFVLIMWRGKSPSSFSERIRDAIAGALIVGSLVLGLPTFERWVRGSRMPEMLVQVSAIEESLPFIDVKGGALFATFHSDPADFTRKVATLQFEKAVDIHPRHRVTVVLKGPFEFWVNKVMSVLVIGDDGATISLPVPLSGKGLLQFNIPTTVRMSRLMITLDAPDTPDEALDLSIIDVQRRVEVEQEKPEKQPRPGGRLAVLRRAA